jgi:cytoskeletal protein RodZ
MAGNSVRSSIGVGPALRRAREIRGITLEAAARDTRLPVDRLQALEDEAFAVLPGEGYTRASLRTYSHYLGLKPDKVLGVYSRYADDPGPPPPPGRIGRVEQALAAARIRDSQKFFLVLAAVVLVSLVGVGFVSRGGAPTAADLESVTPASAVASPALVEVIVEAIAPVDVSATVDDGEAQALSLHEAETVSFAADRSLDLTVSDAGAVRVTVGGRDVGLPGPKGEPWSATFAAPAAATTSMSPAG